MLEVYCDSSYNEGEDSYIGCVVLRNDMQIHQSTTKVLGDPRIILIVNFQPLILLSLLSEFFPKAIKK
ncbi:hypothetical protein [Methanosarcina horonobensis]|uniref:hypothetical protein n=1 Tax=Methanosarcina horonobensis TaxID=418008 RepID=UPI000A78B859|nr:hypothetical protein [Methanosarcina horonobensis]